MRERGAVQVLRKSVLATQVKFVNWTFYRGPILHRLLFADNANCTAPFNPGAEFTQVTYGTHPWLLSDASDKCLAIHLPEIGDRDRNHC